MGRGISELALQSHLKMHFCSLWPCPIAWSLKVLQEVWSLPCDTWQEHCAFLYKTKRYGA